MRGKKISFWQLFEEHAAKKKHLFKNKVSSYFSHWEQWETVAYKPWPTASLHPPNSSTLQVDVAKRMGFPLPSALNQVLPCLSKRQSQPLQVQAGEAKFQVSASTKFGGFFFFLVPTHRTGALTQVQQSGNTEAPGPHPARSSIRNSIWGEASHKIPEATALPRAHGPAQSPE